MEKMAVLNLEERSDGVAEEDPVVDSSDGVEHTDHPCDEPAPADIDAEGSAVKESAESPDGDDSDKEAALVYEESLKKMRMFFRRAVKRAFERKWTLMKNKCT